MSIRAGDVRQTIIKGREFDPAPEGSVEIFLGGFANENQATGNGGMHTKQNRELGGFDGLSLSIDASRKDVEFLQQIWNSGELVPVSITLASGITYSGSLKGEGKISYNGGDGKVEIAMRGPIFEQI